MDSKNEELYHHGVKGMKWGIRRTSAQLGNKSSSTKKSFSAKKSSSAKKVKHNNTKSPKRSGRAKKIAASIDRGRDFINRNKKTIAVAGLSAGLIAAGAGWAGSALMTSYNLASMDLHNYLLRTYQIADRPFS